MSAAWEGQASSSQPSRRCSRHPAARRCLPVVRLHGRCLGAQLLRFPARGHNAPPQRVNSPCCAALARSNAPSNPALLHAPPPAGKLAGAPGAPRDALAGQAVPNLRLQVGHVLLLRCQPALQGRWASAGGGPPRQAGERLLSLPRCLSADLDSRRILDKLEHLLRDDAARRLVLGLRRAAASRGGARQGRGPAAGAGGRRRRPRGWRGRAAQAAARARRLVPPRSPGNSAAASAPRRRSRPPSSLPKRC